MRIVAFSHSSELGGSERALAEVAVEAHGRGHEVVVALPKGGPLVGQLRARGLPAPRYVSLHRWMSRRGRGLVGFLRLCQCVVDLLPCIALLWRLRPDVVLVNSSVTPAPLVAGWLCGLRSAVVVRELIKTGESLQSFLPKTTIVAVLQRAADLLIAVSGVVQRQCGASEMIYSNSAAQTIAPAVVDRPTRSGPLRAVCVGSLMSDKRPEDAVRATSLAHSAGAEVSLRIYGPGSMQDVARVNDAIREGQPGIARYCGEVAGAAEVLANADVLLMTSVHEAFGRVTTEALMAGVPVLGYRRGGTAEVIELTGGGVLVDATPAALARVLVDLCEHGSRLEELRDEAIEAGAFWRSYRSEVQIVDRLEALASDGSTAKARQR